ncbi:hypothetical protein ACFSCX_23745 [Bacillus salitolerans]|uniref:Uncharacterized protein n=1 Tax=Bacillus salitolerans TaxID=1437434 RepID=A0ABW4LXB4_9BACI
MPTPLATVITDSDLPIASLIIAKTSFSSSTFSTNKFTSWLYLSRSLIIFGSSFQIEQELNSNLIYQIEDLRNTSTSVEAHKVLELSSSVLITVDKTIALFNSIQKIGENTLNANAIQFWKENEYSSENGQSINESIEKDLDASLEKVQKIPNELTQRSKSSITSINVQKELLTIKIAQMKS